MYPYFCLCLLRPMMLVLLSLLLGSCDNTGQSGTAINLPANYATEFGNLPDIERTVIASGTLKPVGEVEVGTEVSGRIAELLVDFNDVVKEDQVIARINPEFFEAQKRQAEAALVDAQATVMMRAVALEHTQRSLKRIKLLRKSNGASADELDQVDTDMKMARAELAQAKAVVTNRTAALEEAEVSLARTAIRTPIDGVIISRDVMPGQTVAASFEAPRLFRIARTLSEMEIHAHVDEADIGRIHIRQRAIFTVPAYGTRSYTAQVIQVRVAPEIVENVVTYTVVLSANNEDESLLPGMTAIIEIDIKGNSGDNSAKNTRTADQSPLSN
jgi:HlyD family secretion protein